MTLDSQLKPPTGGWTLKEAMRVICPDELAAFIEAERATHAELNVPIGNDVQLTRGSGAISEFWAAKDRLIETFCRPLRSGLLRASGRCGSDQPREEVPFDRWDTMDWFNIEQNAIGESRPAGRMYYGLRVIDGESKSSVEPVAPSVKQPSGEGSMTPSENGSMRRSSSHKREQAAQANGNAGRPLKYDWERAFDIVLAPLVKDAEFESQNHLLKRIQEAFGTIGEETPDEKSIRDHLKKHWPGLRGKFLR